MPGAPICEPAPTVYSGVNTGADLAGNMRPRWIDESDGTVTEFAYGLAAPGTAVQCFGYTAASGLGYPSTGSHYLDILTPISYDNLVPNNVLYDFIARQARVEYLKLKCKPVADVSSSGWSGNYGNIDDDVDDADYKGGADAIVTVTPGSKYRVKLDPFPASTYYHGGVLRIWYIMNRATDTGVGLNATVYKDNTSTVIDSERVGMVQTGSGFNKRYVEIKFRSKNTAGVSWVEVELEAIRNAAGGAPNPLWAVYAMDMICWVDDGVEWVDTTTFLDSSLGTYFSTQSVPYLLIGSCYSDYRLEENLDEETETFRDFVMAIMAHAPELIMYLNYQGQLALKKIPTYASVSDPMVISSSNGRLHEVSSIEVYDERRVTSITAKYGVKVLNWATNVLDPDLDYLVNTYQQSVPSERPAELEIERRFIQGNQFGGNDAYKMSRCVDNMLYLWSKDIVAVDLRCSIECLQADIADVVILDEPDIGYDQKKFLIVGRNFDIDNEQVELLLFDLEFDN